LNTYASFADYIAENTPEDSVVYTYVPETGQQALVSTEDGGTEDNQIIYTYDKLGRLSDVVAKKINESTTTLTNSYEYTAVGSRESLTYANDNYARYQYDALNRLTDVTNSQTNGGAVLSSFAYSHYADGMRRSLDETIKYQDASTESRTITYTYDNLNRLQIEHALAGTDGYNAEYTYDLAGNRLTRGVTIKPSQTQLYTEYAYDEQDHLIRETNADTIPSAMIEREDGPYYAHMTDDGLYYTTAGDPEKIGQVKAYFLGLPSVVSHYVFGFVMLLLLVTFIAPAAGRLYIRVTRREPKRRRRRRLTLVQKGLCVLLAYIMLIGPNGFQTLAKADTLYDDLTTATWGQSNRIVEYGHWSETSGGIGRTGDFTPGYDANGSMTKKITWDEKIAGDDTDDEIIEEITYEYNLQNRLAKVNKSGPWEDLDIDSTDDDRVVEITLYHYSPAGIKVRSEYEKYYVYNYGQGEPDESFVLQDYKDTDYLIDSANHTGYSQTIKETVTDTDTTETTYIIGSDVLAQATSATADQYLLYDGHGSTRQVMEYDDTPGVEDWVIKDSYSYDAYGVMLGGERTTQTNLLYTGEQYDTSSQQYYLRARYYDPMNGRFNRLDPFAGSVEDPQSLHKYLYCHANPVNGVDYSGMDMSLTSVLSGSTIVISMASLLMPVLAGAYLHMKEEINFFSSLGLLLSDGSVWKDAAYGLGVGVVGGALVKLIFRGVMKKLIPGVGLFVAVMAFWQSLKMVKTMLSGEIPRDQMERDIAVIIAATILVVAIGAVSRNKFVRKGAENDAAWRKLSGKEKTLYEIGSSTMPENIHNNPKYSSLDPVTKGRAYLKDFGFKGTMLNWMKGLATQSHKTYDTGFTPLGRGMFDTLFGPLNLALGSENLLKEG